MTIPLIHVTDLYNPPQDPDDHFDLATIAALKEINLLGVILDITSKFLHAAPRGRDIRRDPGFVPVAQLAYLTGKAVPVAVGPFEPLSSLTDDVTGRPHPEQTGVELLLRLLRTSSQPVTISVVGSARVVAAAFNRDPSLVREKTAAVVLNAGTSAGSHVEWNVGIDPFAFIALWRSGIPIHWYPCATEKGAFENAHERGTHWEATHGELISTVRPRLKAWFNHALQGSPRGDIIHLLDESVEGPAWDKLLAEKRHLWSTASLIMAAGRKLVETKDGWRFLSPETAEGAQEWPMALEPISAVARDTGFIEWSLTERSSHHLLFRRGAGVYGFAMAEALSALLQSLDC